MCGPPSLCRVLTPAAASCAGSRLCLRRLSFCDVSDADEACCEDPGVLALACDGPFSRARVSGDGSGQRSIVWIAGHVAT
jgi:hypothetical protein